MRRSSPVTAAGPSRIVTGFPIKLCYERLKYYAPSLIKKQGAVNIFQRPSTQAGDTDGLDTHGVEAFFIGKEVPLLPAHAKGQGVGKHADGIVSG